MLVQNPWLRHINNQYGIVHVTFKKRFDPPAIIVYPEELDAFLYCDFEKKDNGDKELPIYDDNNCSKTEFQYYSRVHKQHRKVLVFKGPANVALGEKNHLLFMLNLRNRTVSNELQSL